MVEHAIEAASSVEAALIDGAGEFAREAGGIQKELRSVDYGALPTPPLTDAAFVGNPSYEYAQGTKSPKRSTDTEGVKLATLLVSTPSLSYRRARLVASSFILARVDAQINSSQLLVNAADAGSPTRRPPAARGSSRFASAMVISAAQTPRVPPPHPHTHTLVCGG